MPMEACLSALNTDTDREQEFYRYVPSNKSK